MHNQNGRSREDRRYPSQPAGSRSDAGPGGWPGGQPDHGRGYASRGGWVQSHEGAYGSVARGGWQIEQPDPLYPRGGSGGSLREFSGKGPKGYIRSDERIREDVCERLSEGHLDASDIDVQVKDGEVMLSGLVADRRTKRLVEELIDPIRGIRDVENKLKIRTAAPRSDTSRGEGPRLEGAKAGDPQRTPDSGKDDGQKLPGPPRPEGARA